MKQKPTILIAATERWYPTARLGMALADAGCNVEAVCPPGHPLDKTSAVRHAYTYHGLTPLMSFVHAIQATKPDLIVPADDLATRQLHQLYDRARRDQNGGMSLCELIERSLGAPESFPTVFSRSGFINLAREEGLRVPQTEVISNTGDLRKWIARVGLPTVLKANGTSGGDGVRIVRTLEEAERALRKLQAPPLLARAFKRALANRDQTLVWPSLLRRRSVVNAQEFVAGREATSAIACWNGAVLASLHFEVVKKVDLAGHATVLRMIENAEMSAAAEKVARRLKLSGFHGLDFMLAANTGDAYLIEINPRTTQVGHLTLGPGRDLPAALYAALTGESIHHAPKVTESDTIALFPQEWRRDPVSTYLQSGYHDVPWQEPGLVRDCIDKGKKHSHRSIQQALPFPSLAPAERDRSTEVSRRGTWVARKSESRYE
ncbi:MAG: ATP-grasp domain-containing protein [Candidatus Sulfotelmatobacter sp.]